MMVTIPFSDAKVIHYVARDGSEFIAQIVLEAGAPFFCGGGLENLQGRGRDHGGAIGAHVVIPAQMMIVVAISSPTTGLTISFWMGMSCTDTALRPSVCVSA
jgi:hypothetical protein